MNKIIEVVAAVIVIDSKFLCCKRGPHKLSYIANRYEFPGGKIEKNESHKEALSREIKEELNIKIIIDSFIQTINYKYPDFDLVMHCYLCKTLSEIITLNDHITYKLSSINDISTLKWLDADIKLIKHLVDNKIGQ